MLELSNILAKTYQFIYFFNSSYSSLKNKLLKKFINKKDPTLKKEFHISDKKFTLHPYEEK